MRAARANRYGGPDVVAVEEVEAPALVPGGVRVAVVAAAVNYPDLLMLGNRYQVTIPLPYTIGAEFSGTVLEVAAEVTGVKPGDTVIGLATHGAFAEEVVLDEKRITPVPRHIDPRSAAAFGVTYTTAYHALVTLGHVQAGDWVVVLGAAGGVGLAAVDVARQLGANVLAAAGGPERLAFLAARGAAVTCDYRSEDLKAVIKEATGGGADVVVDPVGGSHAEAALRALTWGGRFVVVGFASGEIPSIPLNLVLLKGVVVTGFENRTILDHLPEVAPAHRREVLGLLTDGKIAPYVHATFPLDRVGQALAEVADRKVMGKVVVDVAAGSDW